MEENQNEQLTPSCSCKGDISDLVQMEVYAPKCRYNIYSLRRISFFLRLEELSDIGSDGGREENPSEIARI